MPRRTNRGNTKAQKYQSYRVDAIDYVKNRDAKINEIVADTMRKNPNASEARVRALVTQEWANMEARNNVRNTVRSLDLGYDERKMIDRLNDLLSGTLRDRLDATLASLLRSKLKG